MRSTAPPTAPSTGPAHTPPALSRERRIDRLPPQSFFLVSALFHYLGPSFAVLLFARVDVLGVACLRIVSAAAAFALWRRPWRFIAEMERDARWALVRLGFVLAAMNSLFYLAVARLPLSTVGAVEFLGTVLIAAAGARTRRNAAALLLTTAGVITIADIRISGQPLGFLFAFGNCALFVLYVILGHRFANDRVGGRRPNGSAMGGIDRLAASMLVAAIAIIPVGLSSALPVFAHPLLLMAAVGVGVCSSVIPYVTDQLAMARLPRATFALMLALLPMFATIIGAVVLRQIPTGQDLIGVALVIAGVALHEARSRTQPSGCGVDSDVQEAG
jgi:inner membrane transporter RhtA